MKLEPPTGKGEERKVKVFQSPMLEYPEMYLSVYVHGPKWEHPAFAKMFAKAKCRGVTSPDLADLVVFTGGDDVNPALYGEEPHATTSWDDERDTSDMKMYLHCYNEGIPMFGVCRGAQFGWVMEGGKLFQNIDKHNQSHSIFDLINHKTIKDVSSVHHQAVRPSSEMCADIIANCYRSTFRDLNPNEKDIDAGTPDIEAFFLKDTCFFGVQGHPEYVGYDNYTRWCLEWIQELIQTSTDVELKDTEAGKLLRLKQSVRNFRKDNRIYPLKEAA